MAQSLVAAAHWRADLDVSLGTTHQLKEGHSNTSFELSHPTLKFLPKIVVSGASEAHTVAV